MPTVPIAIHRWPGQPAAKAGLEPYDVIIEFNGKRVKSVRELVQSVTAVPVGESAPIKVLRNGKEKTFQIKVSERKSRGRSRPVKKTKPKKGAIDLGMEVEEITRDIRRELGLDRKVKGVVVGRLAYGGPADTAGLSRGDVIIEVDRKPVKNVDGFHALLKEEKSYLLRVLRMSVSGEPMYRILVLDLKGQK